MMSSQSDARKAQIAQFEVVIQGLLQASNQSYAKSEASQVILAVQYYLKQFNLQNCEVADILIEVYLRGRRKIERGEFLTHPMAFIRVVSRNIIREQFRRNQRLWTVGDFEIEYFLPSENLSDRYLDEKTIAALTAFHNLKESDRQAIELHYLQHLAWAEVAALLKLREPTVRQKGRRALNRLRQAYQSILEKAAA